MSHQQTFYLYTVSRRLITSSQETTFEQDQQDRIFVRNLELLTRIFLNHYHPYARVPRGLRQNHGIPLERRNNDYVAGEVARNTYTWPPLSIRLFHVFHLHQIATAQTALTSSSQASLPTLPTPETTSDLR